MLITRDDVEALRIEAGQAGDLAMVEICDLALSDDRDRFERGDRFDDPKAYAWHKCLNVIEMAAARG